MIKSSADALVNACQQYIALCDADKIKRPDFWHFCGWVGEVADDVTKFIRSDGATGCGYDPAADAVQCRAVKQDPAKNRRAADALRRLCTFIRGQYSTAPAWSGAQTNKAVFNQRQDFDGAALIDFSIHALCEENKCDHCKVIQMAKKKRDNQDKAIQKLILVTAILNLIRALIEIISKIIG